MSSSTPESVSIVMIPPQKPQNSNCYSLHRTSYFCIYPITFTYTGKQLAEFFSKYNCVYWGLGQIFIHNYKTFLQCISSLIWCLLFITHLYSVAFISGYLRWSFMEISSTEGQIIYSHKNIKHQQI